MGAIRDRVQAAAVRVAMVALAGCGGDAADPSNSDGAQFVRLEEAAGGEALTPAPEVSKPAAAQAAPAPVPPSASDSGSAPVAEPAPLRTAKPEVRPAPSGRLEERERAATAALESGNDAVASRGFSELLLEGVRSDSTSREQLRSWSAGLSLAQARHRWNRRGSWPSVEVTVAPGDSLIAIRARVLQSHPGLLISTGLIARANQLQSETAIRPGDVLRIPTDRPSVQVDISARWMLYLLGDEVAASWEVGVGKESTPTRAGRYTVGLKQKDPMWSPVGREPVPFGDPQNPLGTRWLAWFDGGSNTSLGFHGTNDPAGIGQWVSDGCVRMRNADVELLYEILPKDAPVIVSP